jgi:hypothetical protein
MTHSTKHFGTKRHNRIKTNKDATLEELHLCMRRSKFFYSSNNNEEEEEGPKQRIRESATLLHPIP